MAETPSELQAEVEKLERKHLENPAGRYFVPLANAYRKLGELELAEARLREGLRKHPEYLSAHIVLGRVLADRGASVEAAEEFRYVLSVDPQNLIALRTLGELAMSEGRTEEAGRWYRELLGVDPMNDEARQALSELDARAPVEERAEVAEEDFEGGAWWTRSVTESDVPEPVLEGVAHGAMDDWAGPIAELDEAPPAPEAGQPYSGEANGEFRIGGEPGTETLLELDAAYAADELSAEPAEGDDDVEFVTETIAELYARQGFHDRAADVYRELLRQRGPDAALERRLAEVERMAAGLPPLEEITEVAMPVEVAPEAAPADALPVLEDFDFGAFGDEPPLEPAWAEAVADAAPVAVAAAAAEDAFAASFAEGFAGYGEEVDRSAAPVEVAAREPEHAAPEGGSVAAMLGELLAWRAPRPSAEPQEADVVESAESVAMPADEVPAAEEHADSFSFDEYFGATDVSEPEPEPDAAPAAAAPAAASAAAPADEEEEDLESFQTWLRSLKR